MAVKTLLDPRTKGELPQTAQTIPKRFKDSWAYLDEEERYFLGTMQPITIPPHPTDQLYVLEAGDIARPDLVAYKFYKNPRLYWPILWLNGISDPFEGMFVGMLVRIPSLHRVLQRGIS